MKAKSRRTNWLREFEIAVTGVFVITVLWTLFRIGMSIFELSTGKTFLIPLTIDVPADAVADVTLHDGALTSGKLDPQTDISIEVAHPTLEQHLWDMLSWLPYMCVVAMIMWLLVRLLRGARRHELFTTGAARNLRWVGWIAIIGGSVAYELDVVSGPALATTVTDRGMSLMLSLPLGWLICGFASLAVADIVAHGVRMREDLDGVI